MKGKTTEDISEYKSDEYKTGTKRQRASSILRDERLSRRSIGSNLEMLQPPMQKMTASILHSYESSRLGEPEAIPMSPILKSKVQDIRYSQSETISIPRHHIRSISFPASNTPIVTESSYLAGLACPSPAASYLSKFAADSNHSNVKTGSFVICENSILGNYIVGKVIGRGSVSECRDACPLISPETYQSLHSDKNKYSVDKNPRKSWSFENVVLKIVRGSSNSSIRASFDKEISIWKSLNHPNILPLLDILGAEDINATVSPKAEMGDLLVYIREHGSLPIETSKHIFKQLCLAVHYLHNEQHIYHRDIKLENILLHINHHVYLTDFGLSEYYCCKSDDHLKKGMNNSTSNIERKHSEHICNHCKGLFASGVSKSSAIGRHSMPASPTLGSPASVKSPYQLYITSSCNSETIEGYNECGAGSMWYCPPEELVPEMRSSFPCICSRKPYAPKGDIWSLGVVLYAMLTGSLPFLDEYFPRLQMTIRNGEYPELSEEIPVTAKNLVRGMLTVDIDSRLSIDKVLNHEWLTNK